MTKSIITISILSSLILFSTGCGGGSDKKTDPKDAVVEFKTSGTYDLRQYITATQNQINNYVEKTFTNNKGKKEYANTADETSYYATRFDINNTTIKEFNDNDLDLTYDIQTTKIIEKDADDNTTMNIARYADNGDYVYKKDETIQLNGITFTAVYACKISDHLSSKEVNGNTYNDILEITCEGSTNSQEGAKLNGNPLSIESESSLKSYLAKGEGIIWEEDETCTSTTINKTTSKECEKELTEVTTINR
jgi:hypothetical protein